MLREMDEGYVGRLRELYNGRVPGGADLVTYWFEKARAYIESGKAKRAGLVATNSIRGGANRKVLDRICESGWIFNAWSDEPWVNEGAAVRVSLIGFEGKDAQSHSVLDGKPVAEIYADLTSKADGVTEGLDLTKVRPLMENMSVSFQGSQKIGNFDIPGELARQWLQLPNPNGRPNSDVIKLSWNGIDVTRRNRDGWIIDFGTEMSQKDASLYEAPFEYLSRNVKPIREKNNREAYRKHWWRHGEPRIAMRAALMPLRRYIVTPEVSKHRIFKWASKAILPDKRLIVIAFDDDMRFGVLHSHINEVWTLACCTWIGVGNDPVYSPDIVFKPFPFPEGLTPNVPAADYADDPRAKRIAEAAKRLNELRENWLNPPEWVKRVPEVVPGYPDRILPIDEHAAKELKKRTLTNLYNEKPAWLVNAHRELDEAVAAAYGWPADLTDEEVLRRLLELNLERVRG